MENLMEGLLNEITRVTEIIVEYRSLPKGAGYLAAFMMDKDIETAKKAINEGNTILMLQIYNSLQSYEL